MLWKFFPYFVIFFGGVFSISSTPPSISTVNSPSNDFTSVFPINLNHSLSTTESTTIASNAEISEKTVALVETTTIVFEISTENPTTVNESNLNVTSSTKPMENVTIIPTTSKPTPTTPESRFKSIINPSKHNFLRRLNSKHLIRKYDPDKDKPCTCDLTVKFCDLNCCCDPDCQEIDLEEFSTCEEKSPAGDSLKKYCFDEDLIWRNNTQFVVEYDTAELFCVLKENLPPILPDSEKPAIGSKALLKEILENNFVWPEYKQTNADRFNPNKYIHGSDVWIISKNTSLIRMAISTNYITNTCVGRKNVQYLVDGQIKCSIFDGSLEPTAFDLKNVYEFVVISSPDLFNVSWMHNIPQACPTTVCLTPNFYACDTNLHTCTPITNENVTKFHLNCDNKTCTNWLINVKYVFHHNATVGIKKLDVFINVASQKLDNFRMKNYIEWVSGEKINVNLMRSGNPGYLPDKPILFGYPDRGNTTNTTKLENDARFLRNFLAVPKNIRGKCHFDDNNYHVVKFNVNLMTKCILTLKLNETNPCVHLQTSIFAIYPNVTNAYFGMYGNANRDKLTDWSRVFVTDVKQPIVQTNNGELTCANIVQQVQVHIVFERVNLRNVAKQNKIVAVWFDLIYGNVKVLEDVDFVVRTDVKFYDVTGTAQVHYAQPPKFEIKLPHDFFYPFMNNGGGVFGDNSWVWMLCVVCFVELYKLM